MEKRKMHKDEAAYGYGILGNPDRVKITKFLYVMGDMNKNQLASISACSLGELESHLQLMEEANLIIKNGDMYSANKEYIDTLMDFVRVPCGCTHR